MERTEINYFHRQQTHAVSAAVNCPNPNQLNASSEPTLFPHSVAGKAPTPAAEPVVRRKRGRPRKYDSPEAAAAARRAASYYQHQHQQQQRTQSQSKTEEQAVFRPSPSTDVVSSNKKPPVVSIGSAGQSFTPHVINLAAGEDVAQKIMLLAQQCKRELCVLSASGAIKSASLRQPATSGGNVTYDGYFDILTLSGSYIRTDLGGRAGALTACLCSPDGQIIGGGIGGPLVAAGPVQIILATFQLETKKDLSVDTKGNASLSLLHSPVSMSTGAYRSVIDTSGRYQIKGTNDHPNMGGGAYIVPKGRTGHGTHESPENGDYDQLSD